MQSSLNILVNFIIGTYFLDTRCILIFTDNQDFDYKASIPFVSVQVKDGIFDPTTVFNSFGCQGIIISTQMPVTTFLFMVNEIRHGMDRFNSRRYLFVPGSDQKEEVLNIFNTTAVEYVADLLVIIPSIKDDEGIETNIWFNEDYDNYQLLTHKFVGPSYNDESIVLDEYLSMQNTFLNGTNLYPDKLTNADGRPWKIATFSYMPYSVPATNEGTELELSLQFCKKHSLTPNLVVDEEGEWGEIYDNWTGYGILGNVMYDKGDVGLAALYTWAHEYFYLDLSKPVVRTGITCIAPAPIIASGWLVPFFSYTYDMWIAVAVSFLLCIVFLSSVDSYRIRTKTALKKKAKKNKFGKIIQKSVFHTTAIFLIQSLSAESDIEDNIKKPMYGCMFLFALMIASSYSSGLASSMTIPRFVGAIKTVQDLVDSEIQWGATSIAWIMSIMDAPEYNYVTLVERFLKTDGNELKKHNNERFAYSVERLPAGYFAIGEYVTEEGAEERRLMVEDLYWEQCVLMTKKSSIWMPALDDFILLVAQTGIQSTWEFRVATTYMNSRVQRTVKFSSHHSESDTGPVELKLEHVQGAFGLWLLGISISILNFICEVASKCRKKQTVLKVKENAQ